VKARVKARVEVVEPMGNEIYVYFSTKPGAMHVARLTATDEPELRQEMGFVFDTSKVHLFDAETERAILETRTITSISKMEPLNASGI
jgi:multiple sugar transport system ATP-binding protein